MFHPDTQFLIDHWTSLARRTGARGGIPHRAAIEPDALGLRLPRAFVARRAGEDAVIRLAGSWVEGFHGEVLKDQSLLSLWRTASRPLVSTALVQTVREGRPVVIVALAGSVGAQIEITLLPLRGPSGEPDRLLGLYAPAATLTLAMDEPAAADGPGIDRRRRGRARAPQPRGRARPPDRLTDTCYTKSKPTTARPLPRPLRPCIALRSAAGPERRCI